MTERECDCDGETGIEGHRLGCPTKDPPARSEPLTPNEVVVACWHYIMAGLGNMANGARQPTDWMAYIDGEAEALLEGAWRNHLDTREEADRMVAEHTTPQRIRRTSVLRAGVEVADIPRRAEEPTPTKEPCRACGCADDTARAYYWKPSPACVDGKACLARQDLKLDASDLTQTVHRLADKCFKQVAGRPNAGADVLVPIIRKWVGDAVAAGQRSTKTWDDADTLHAMRTEIEHQRSEIRTLRNAAVALQEKLDRRPDVIEDVTLEGAYQRGLRDGASARSRPDAPRTGLDAGIFSPFSVTCPRCGAPPGTECSEAKHRLSSALDEDFVAWWFSLHPTMQATRAAMLARLAEHSRAIREALAAVDHGCIECAEKVPIYRCIPCHDKAQREIVNILRRSETPTPATPDFARARISLRRAFDSATREAYRKVIDDAWDVVEQWMKEPENPLSDGLLERRICELEESILTLRAKYPMAVDTHGAERPTAAELLRQGGEWLGAARTWLRWNTRNGDQVTWGSGDLIEPKLSVRQIEYLAAEVAAAAMRPQPSEERLSQALKARWKAEAELAQRRSSEASTDTCEHDGGPKDQCNPCPWEDSPPNPNVVRSFEATTHAPVKYRTVEPGDEYGRGWNEALDAVYHGVDKGGRNCRHGEPEEVYCAMCDEAVVAEVTSRLRSEAATPQCVYADVCPSFKTEAATCSYEIMSGPDQGLRCEKPEGHNRIGTVVVPHGQFRPHNKTSPSGAATEQPASPGTQAVRATDTKPDGAPSGSGTIPPPKGSE